MILHDHPQGSPEWAQARCGIPSASEFKRIITSKGAISESLDVYARELAAEVYAGKPLDAFDGNVWMLRGQEMEAEARDLYAFTHDVTPVQVGFITDDKGQYGCSPDALIGDDGLLEIKCCKAEKHIEVVSYHAKHGKVPSAYVMQPQGQLFVTGRKWCDMMFYSPEMPPLVYRHLPDVALFTALTLGLAKLLEARDEHVASLRNHAQQTRT